MAVRRRRRISNEDRERLVSAFENPNEEYLTVADALGVGLYSQGYRCNIDPWWMNRTKTKRRQWKRENWRWNERMPEQHYQWKLCDELCVKLEGEEKIAWKIRGTRQVRWALDGLLIDPFNKFGIHNFHPMTSNYFQFGFWILFDYVYSLNKPETSWINKTNRVVIDQRTCVI